jgi:DNA-binding SARP family transcriptional activator
MAVEMEFCLLGPMAVRTGGVLVPVARGNQRAVLAALLLRANEPVRVDDLAEILWGASPPPSVRPTVQNYVKRLRRVFGEDGQDRIRTTPHGYLIEVNFDEFDVSRFAALTAQARSAAKEGCWEQASARAASALSLWRGKPLVDVESEALTQKEVPRLMEVRLQALETRLDAELHLGGHADVIPELQHLTDAHPTHENLHALLMLALYRCGRQAEALAVYRRLREVLIEDFGAEPGTETRDLHHRILTGDPALAVPAPRSVPAGPVTIVPRELPAAVPHFMGRDTELSVLTKLAGKAARGTVVISAIDGTAGVGKTALALHWANQVSPAFPDGQLYVNLRGFDPGQRVQATDALAGFLRALGVPGKDVPAELDERAARYRSLLAGRQVLLVLDNAGSAEQVRPLLPGQSGCVAVVTSRDSLAGLVAREGAHRIDLDLLPLPDAVNLLRALIGPRVDADPAVAAELAAQCSRLPLALRVAAELAVARPEVSLADLVSEMADIRQRLDKLNVAEDTHTRVRAVFFWSYRHLGADAARAFRLAGLHPGPSFDRYAIAAMADITVDHADHLIGLLARAHLVHSCGPGRVGIHDLLRAYAGELAASRDSEDERRAALTRLFDHYLYVASAAMDILFPAEHHRRPEVLAPATPVPRFTGTAAARSWLDAERVNLVAVADHTGAHGWSSHTTRLAATISRYFETGGYFAEAITVSGLAYHAARQAGDYDGEAFALNKLGIIDWWQGSFAQAADRQCQALALFTRSGNRLGQAMALADLGMADAQQSRYAEAGDHFRQALALYREVGDQRGEAMARGNLGALDGHQGRYQQALEHHQQVLALYRKIGDQNGEAYALTNIGQCECRLGRSQQAKGCLHEALSLFRENGNRSGEAHALTTLGNVALQEDQHRQADEYHAQGLMLCREAGDRYGEAVALNGLGDATLAAGRPDEARLYHTRALAVAAEIGERQEQAHAHDGLARGYHANGDVGRARGHWREALAHYTAVGVPEAEEIRNTLYQLELPATCGVARTPEVAHVAAQEGPCDRRDGGAPVSSVTP